MQFFSLYTSSGIILYLRAVLSIHTPYISLFELLKSPSISRIAQSLLTSVTPSSFSNMTERPRDHMDNAIARIRIIDIFVAWN